MGFFLTIAGIIIVVYAISSVVGLWLCYQVMDALAEDDILPEPLQEAPDHHIDMLANYARGWRRHAWAVSIVALFTAMIALATGSPLAFYAFGISLAIDNLLFVTYDELPEFLAQTNLQERLIDVAQGVAVLAALALLMWINLRAGEILG
jgi:hypothetical protein